jgi:hypothetical protein
MIRGPQIKDGVIYRDFESSSNRGRHALGVHANGEIKPYMIEDGWTAQKMKDAGVVDTFTFGPLLTVNGQQRNVEADTWASSLTGGAISGRTILGVAKNHDIILITVVGTSSEGTGVGGNNIAALAFAEGCHHSILLDGGGSTQAMAGGFTFHPSSDSAGVRTIGDALLAYARVTQAPDSSLGVAADPINVDTSVAVANTGAYAPVAIVRAGVVSLSGQISSKAATFPANAWTIIGSVPDKARPSQIPVGGGGFYMVGTNTSTALKLQIRAYGQISIYPTEPITTVNLHGVTFNGM